MLHGFVVGKIGELPFNILRVESVQLTIVSGGLAAPDHDEKKDVRKNDKARHRRNKKNPAVCRKHSGIQLTGSRVHHPAQEHRREIQKHRRHHLEHTEADRQPVCVTFAHTPDPENHRHICQSCQGIEGVAVAKNDINAQNVAQERNKIQRKSGHDHQAHHHKQRAQTAVRRELKNAEHDIHQHDEKIEILVVKRHGRQRTAPCHEGEKQPATTRKRPAFARIHHKRYQH